MTTQQIELQKESSGKSIRAQTVPYLPAVMGARAANIVLTAQFQVAYACAMGAAARARRARTYIESAWPATPVRQIVVDIYRAQEQSAESVASDVLVNARQRCGLAFARMQ